MPHGPPHFGTEITPNITPNQAGANQIEDAKQKEREDRRSCIARGGKWDPINKICDLDLKLAPESLPSQEPPKVTPGGPEIFTGEGGRAGGITLPDGRTFFGLSPDEVADIAGQQADIKARPEGTEPVGTAQARANEQLRIQQSIAQIGQLGKLDPSIQADINISQALTAGLARVIPGAVGGAAIGGAAGLVGTGGALSIPGAVAVGAAGAVTGFVSGILGNIKEQQRGELQAADIELRNARTNMRQLAMLASQDPANADVYIKQYNDQLTRVHQARRQTKAEVTGDLNSFMEDGREQLADFDAFLQEGGIADVYGQKLAIALSSGVPLSINGEGLLE